VTRGVRETDGAFHTYRRTMSGTAWAWARPLAALATLTVVVWRLGIGPFLDGVRAVDGAALAAGALIGVLTTVCCAWRWMMVARGLNLRLSFPTAVAAYYRSVFLNLTLPGGVAGDVHRGVSHGRDVRDVGLALRAVAWERTAGQVVQAVLTVAILVALPSPVRLSMPLMAAALVAAVIAVVLLGRAQPGAGRSRWARVRRAIAGDVRDALLARRAWPAIVLASALVVIGHATTFVIAARTAGATASLSRLLPLALLVMLAMVLPSVAGWGPREGATAWAFAAAGLGAAQGVATAVVYGIMVLVASLPGAIVLVAASVPRAAVAQTDGAADA
jgi:glycosyltransferase 2 family protein